MAFNTLLPALDRGGQWELAVLYGLRSSLGVLQAYSGRQKGIKSIVAAVVDSW